MAIRELLKEELENSLRMERDYGRAMAELPRGSLVRKNVGKQAYYYLAYREGPKVRFQYMGRNVDKGVIAKYREAKQLRAQYRKHRSVVRKQIRFLRRVLHAKQAV
ncbi:MAG TPA: hypothetical protein PLP16_12305, partial [Smithellaceae bacterium]|nr:hypothetical protein [Smithellaceae bacterium]